MTSAHVCFGNMRVNQKPFEKSSITGKSLSFKTSRWQNADNYFRSGIRNFFIFRTLRCKA